MISFLRRKKKKKIILMDVVEERYLTLVFGFPWMGMDIFDKCKFQTVVSLCKLSLLSFMIDFLAVRL